MQRGNKNISYNPSRFFAALVILVGVSLAYWILSAGQAYAASCVSVAQGNSRLDIRSI